MITLPPINAEITASLAPLRETFAAAPALAKEMAEGMARAIDDAPIFGPAVKARFDSFEQQVREGMARTIKQMRDEAVQANVDEEIKLRLYGPTQMEEDIAQAGAAISSIKAKAAEAAGEGGVLESLKGSFGRGSAFFEMSHLMEGAGPVLGLGLAANLLKESTEHAAKMVDEFREGAVSGGELANQIARSIPILGNIYAAGQNIREMITGEQAAIDDVTRATQLQDQATEALAQSHKAVKDAIDQTVKSQQDVTREIQRMGLSGTQLKLFDIDTKGIDQVREIEDHFKQLAGSASEGPKKIIDDLIEERNKLASSGTDAANKRIAEIDEQVKRQRDGLNVVLQQLDAQKKIQETESGILTAEERSKEVMDSINKAKDEAAKHEAAITAEINKQIEEAQKMARQVGMTESQKKLDDAKSEGASPAQLAELKKSLDQFDVSKAAVAKDKHVDEMAKNFHEQMQSESQKVQEVVGQLKDMLSAHKITPDEFNAGLMKLWGEHEEDVRRAAGTEHRASTKFANAIDPAKHAGGALKSQFATGDETKFADLIDPMKQAGDALKFQFASKMDKNNQDDVAQRQLKEQQDMNNWLQQIYENTNVTLYAGL